MISKEQLLLLYSDLLKSPICWNPWNKVVQDHRDGTIYEHATNQVREVLGLPTPWNMTIAESEATQKPIFFR